MAEVTINGETVEAEEGELLFEVIRDQDIEVPHFCYHPELSLAGACRMCLVEIDGTIDISCTRRVEDGMEVETDNEDVEDERRGILEFMLINHPLDCPVCDKGGECPLQDYTMGYGPAESRYHGNKRTFPKFDLGELLTQRQNRCILCYRCTRFYQEEGGREDFRVIERGNDAFVGKQPGGQLESELSGNMVDICPTGTIVTKPYLHKSRPWEQEPVQSIAGMDPIQTPITADVRGNEITRIRPQEDPDFAKPWIDDKVRFVHEYNSQDENRLELPVDEQYFDRFDNLKDSLDQFGDSEIGGLISPDRTLEELHLFQQVLGDNYGSDAIGTYPEVGDVKVNPTDFEQIVDSDFILVAGNNFRESYPMLTPFLRTAARNGAEVAYLSYWGNELTIEPDVYMRETPTELLGRIERLSAGSPEDATDEAILEALDRADNASLITCEGRSLGQELTKASLDWSEDWDRLRLAPGGNSKAAELSFDRPSSAGELLQKASDGDIRALVLYGFDLLREFPNRELVKAAINEVDFLCVADYMENELTDQADVVIPLTTQFEEPGLMVNAEGRIRQRPAVTEHDERILSGWEFLSFLNQGGSEPRTAGEIFDELKETYVELPDDFERAEVAQETRWINDFDHETGEEYGTDSRETTGEWFVFSEPRLFSGDRRAQCGPSIEGMIQEAQLECSEEDAEELGADHRTELSLQINGHAIEKNVRISNDPPQGSVMLPWNDPEDVDLEFYDRNQPVGTARVGTSPETDDSEDA
ncbi:MAG: 2Fe-2S iron-sulfur cluster-binding protein [bacterium]